MKYFPALRLIKIFFFTFISFASVIAQQSRIELKLAEQFSRTGDYESALLLYNKHYSNGDRSVTVINGVNRCLKELNLTEQRISFLKEVSVDSPMLFNYKIDLGSAYHTNDQFDLALKIWQEVYSVKPADIMRYRLVAQAMTNERLFSEAIAVYEEAKDKIKNQETINLDIANLYRAQLDYENATYHLLEYFRAFKKRDNYVQSQLIHMAKDDDAADRIIGTIVDYNTFNDPDLNELLSNLYIRKKDYNHALKIILEIEKKNNDDKFVYLNRFAREAEKDKAFDYAIIAYEFILKNTSSNSVPTIEIKLADACYHSAINLSKSGDKTLADKLIIKAHALLQSLIENKTAQKYLAAEMMGDIHKLYFNDLDEALKNYLFIDIRAINKEEADRLYFKIADIHILKNQLPEASQQYKKVITPNYKSKALFNLAEIMYYKGEFSDAKEMLNTLLLQIGMGDTLANNSMERIFEIDMFLADSSAYAEYARATLLKRQNKYSEAAGKFNEIFLSRKITSYNAGMHAAKLYNQLNKEQEANIILEQLIDKYPDEEQIDYTYYLLGNNYRKKNDIVNALVLYQYILVHYPTSLYSELARTNARELNDRIKENLN